jgi:hypothetical protein
MIKDRFKSEILVINLYSDTYTTLYDERSEYSSRVENPPLLDLTWSLVAN